MKYLIFTAAVLVVMAGCSDEPVSPSGTLPVVQNLTVNSAESKGDTVVLYWDALDVEIDGYHIYFATTDIGSWTELEPTEDTTYVHIAESAGYYVVKASEGLNYSSDNSNEVHTTTNRISGDFPLRVDGSNGFIFGQNNGVLGIADSASFAQDIYIGTADSLLFFYVGNNNPGDFPGGSATRLAYKGTYGNVAPDPGSSDWIDSVQVVAWNHYFVKLTNDHYVELTVDSIYTNGADISMYEYQTISLLRLFDVW